LGRPFFAGDLLRERLEWWLILEIEWTR
jgi:hypothetical protein